MDLDYVGDLDKRISFSGYVFTLGVCLESYFAKDSSFIYNLTSRVSYI